MGTLSTSLIVSEDELRSAAKWVINFVDKSDPMTALIKDVQ